MSDRRSGFYQNPYGTRSDNDGCRHFLCVHVENSVADVGIWVNVACANVEVLSVHPHDQAVLLCKNTHLLPVPFVDLSCKCNNNGSWDIRTTLSIPIKLILGWGCSVARSGRWNPYSHILPSDVLPEQPAVQSFTMSLNATARVHTFCQEFTDAVAGCVTRRHISGTRLLKLRDSERPGSENGGTLVQQCTNETMNCRARFYTKLVPGIMKRRLAHCSLERKERLDGGPCPDGFTVAKGRDGTWSILAPEREEHKHCSRRWSKLQNIVIRQGELDVNLA
ncbi:hypothetical protein BC835DRAFT_1309091 [Cytidiella melzeri]|nr:hypothetical protein BC835DRAFT_1309091 [Cytidiella melzeri]